MPPLPSPLGHVFDDGPTLTRLPLLHQFRGTQVEIVGAGNGAKTVSTKTSSKTRAKAKAKTKDRRPPTSTERDKQPSGFGSTRGAGLCQGFLVVTIVRREQRPQTLMG